jgi:uncharacterized protein DUF4249
MLFGIFLFAPLSKVFGMKSTNRGIILGKSLFFRTLMPLFKKTKVYLAFNYTSSMSCINTMLSSRIVVVVLFSIFFFSCTDPVEPQFEFKEGLIFVEGFASTSLGGSYVVINKSISDFGVNKTKFEEGATVSFENADSGQSIQLIEQEGAYVPPSEFKAAVGDRWELHITLVDGTQIQSSPELVLEPVGLSEIKANYDPELRFNEGSGKFEPGHSISVTFDDPANQENFYYWTFRSFENLVVCNTCYDGIHRNGECGKTPIPTPPYFNYLCETECWRIRFPEQVNIFDDMFSNGKTTTDLPVADIPLYTKENMVVELQQFSLTPAAYEYYRILKDIVDNNSGFNAPPPAALVGNMINVNDSEDFVLGRFTAASSVTKFVYIDRNSIVENILERNDPLVFEPTFPTPYPPPATTYVACEESRYRTAIVPNGWIEQ